METGTWVGDVHISPRPSLSSSAEERRANLASVPDPTLPPEWWGRFDRVEQFAELLSSAARRIYSTAYRYAVLELPHEDGSHTGVFAGCIAKRVPTDGVTRCVARLAATFNLLVECHHIGYGMLHRTVLMRLDAPVPHPSLANVADYRFGLRPPPRPEPGGVAIVCMPFLIGGPDAWKAINAELDCSLFSNMGELQDANAWDRLPG